MTRRLAEIHRAPRIVAATAVIVAAIIISMSSAPRCAADDYLLEQLEIEYELMPAEFRIDSLLNELLMYPPRKHQPEVVHHLTDEDYVEVAEELGVEVAAIKAVVDIETGNRRTGFWQPGKALINFDTSIYSQRAPRRGVSLKDAKHRFPVIFAPIDVKKYGSRQGAMYARLDAACEIDEVSALESVFWGMFQIGGFNWDKCGASSVQEFVELMNRSERDQLELFAAYCRSRKLDRYIREKDWEAFSLRYNGPGYKKLSYDTRMAEAYRRHLRK